MRVAEIRDLAYRFVPGAAADTRLYNYGPRSWWPAHELGHFLVATADECRQPQFGLAADEGVTRAEPMFYYMTIREIAAISISQRMLRRSGHVKLADEEIQYTDEDTLECSYERWCTRAVPKLLRANRVTRLPATFAAMEALLTRKAREVGTEFYTSRGAATRGEDL